MGPSYTCLFAGFYKNVLSNLLDIYTPFVRHIGDIIWVTLCTLEELQLFSLFPSPNFHLTLMC